MHRAPAPPTSIEPAQLRQALEAREPAAAARIGEMRIARAPGRVNLIGEHTDYNEGLVMPAAINLEVRIAFVPTDDRQVTVTSLSTGERATFSLDAIGPRQGGWIDYVAGTAAQLLEAAQPVRGLGGVLASDLPLSAGLSSSAALELVSAWALSGGEPPRLDGLALAQLTQRAENRYVGVNCGLMDQYAVANGVAGKALLFDCRSLRHRLVALPLETHVLVVCHSGSSRKLATSQYNERRIACEAAVAAIAAVDPSVRALRDVDERLLARVAERLDPVTFRRVRHVVTENARVEATEAALAIGDLAAVRELWAASHASLRDDYEVSSPELDALVEIALATPGVAAARMTGAGFGGSTVNLVERSAIGRLRDAIDRDYTPRTGLHATLYPVEPAAGAGLLE